MTDKPSRSRGLGRGLSALMADVTAENDAGPRRPDSTVPIESLLPNPHQPRRTFPAGALEELAASIREKGVIQPLIVRADPGDPRRYQIVAGERRWRAAQLAQLHEVPVIIRSYTDSDVLEVAIIENIQRADLNPVDEAAAYRQLMDRFGHTQDQLAQALGKSRPHIANTLRLLSLPQDVQAMLVTGALTAGHARALIGHSDASRLARQIIDGKLTVRDAENLSRPTSGAAPRRPRTGSRVKDADTQQIEQDLGAALGMRVRIDQDPTGESGRLTLHYRDLGQLDSLLRALSGD